MNKIQVKIDEITNKNIKLIVKNFEKFLWSECMKGTYKDDGLNMIIEVKE